MSSSTADLTTSRTDDDATRRLPASWPAVALGIAVVLVAASFLVPRIGGWNVNEGPIPPLSALWHPRFGPGTVPSALLAMIAVMWAPRLAATMRWRLLLPATYLASAAWLIALATVDGRKGLAGILGKSTEYLPTARKTHDISAMLHDFISRIPYSAAPNNWPIHVAGHPPGILLFFIALVRIGLGGNLAAGLVVVAIAASTPAAVLLTLRRLGIEPTARAVAPFLVFGPAAIWTAVSADAVFAAVAAWGMCLLAVAVTNESRTRAAGWALAGGLLLGYLLFLSYGLVLFGVLALSVPFLARRWRPLPWAVLGVAAVVITFAVAGFEWWKAYPVLSNRYWDGAASSRPGAYWTWADIALLFISAGPALAPALAAVAHRIHLREFTGEARVSVTLVLAAAVSIAVADASQMSRAEVERIWLPFVPWLLVGMALVPARWRRWALGGQVTAALVVQSLVFTRW